MLNYISLTFLKLLWVIVTIIHGGVEVCLDTFYYSKYKSAQSNRYIMPHFRVYSYYSYFNPCSHCKR